MNLPNGITEKRAKRLLLKLSSDMATMMTMLGNLEDDVGPDAPVESAFQKCDNLFARPLRPLARLPIGMKRKARNRDEDDPLTGSRYVGRHKWERDYKGTAYWNDYLSFWACHSS